MGWSLKTPCTIYLTTQLLCCQQTIAVCLRLFKMLRIQWQNKRKSSFSHAWKLYIWEEVCNKQSHKIISNANTNGKEGKKQVTLCALGGWEGNQLICTGIKEEHAKRGQSTFQAEKGRFKAFSRNKTVYAHGPPRKLLWLQLLVSKGEMTEKISEVGRGSLVLTVQSYSTNVRGQVLLIKNREKLFLSNSTPWLQEQIMFPKENNDFSCPAIRNWL